MADALNGFREERKARAGHAVQGFGDFFRRGDDDQLAAAFQVGERGLDLRSHAAGREMAFGEVASGFFGGQPVEILLLGRAVTKRHLIDGA